MTFLRRNLLPLAALLVLPLVMLLPALLPGKSLLPAVMLGKMLPWKGTAAYPADPPWNPLLFDGIAQFYPWRLFAAQSWHAGYVPLWNPYQFCGTPFLANDQSATLYPPNLLFAVMPVAKAFAASAVLHLFLTGAFLYAFLRRRVSVAAALLGAIVWQLSSWQISWLALPTFLCTSAWIPLILLQIERCAERPVLGRGATLGLLLGLMLLAGHLQIALYGVLLAAAYGLTLLVSTAQRHERAQLIGAFALGGILMLLIGAAQLLPTVEVARVSHRAGAHASMAGYQGYIAIAMPVMRLATLFSPSFFGRSTDYWGGTLVPYSETACFVSVAGLLLAWAALAGLWRRATAVERRMPARFFGIVAGVSLLIALGTPLNMLPYFGIPGFGQSGSPARILSLWTLSLAILAAHGLDVVRERGLPKPALYLTLASTLLPLAYAVMVVRNAGLAQNIDRMDLLESFALLILAVAAASARRFALGRTGAIALVAIVAVDLLRAGLGFNLAADDAQIYPATPAITWLQKQRGYGRRIVVVNAPNAVYESTPGVLPPNAATVYGLLDFQGYDSLQTGQYKAFLNQLNGNKESSPLENGNMDLSHFESVESRETVSIASAQWIVSPIALGSATGQPVVAEPNFFVYSEPGSPPRVRTEFPIPVDRAGPKPLTGAGEVDILLDAPTRLAVRTRLAGPLMVADQWYPGWQARVNGQPAPVQEQPYVFRTVPNVPAGATVTMRFEPESFRLGLYLLCVGLLTACGLATASLRRRAWTSDATTRRGGVT